MTRFINLGSLKKAKDLELRFVELNARRLEKSLEHFLQFGRLYAARAILENKLCCEQRDTFSAWKYVDEVITNYLIIHLEDPLELVLGRVHLSRTHGQDIFYKV